MFQSLIADHSLEKSMAPSLEPQFFYDRVTVLVGRRHSEFEGRTDGTLMRE